MARLVQFLLSVFLLFWIVWFARQNLDWQTMANAHSALLAVAVALIPFGWLVRAWRYRALLDASQATGSSGLTLRSSLGAFALFLAGNAALPLRGGEWIRIGYIKERCKDLLLAFIVGAAGAEKVPELIYVGLVLALWSLLGPMDDWAFAASVALAVVGVFYVVAVTSRWLLPARDTRQDQAEAGDPGNPGGARRALQMGKAVLESLRFFTNVKRSMSIALATLTARAWDSVVMLVVAAAFSLPLSVVDTLLIGAALTLGSAISVLPAHIGVFEASVMAGGVLAGMSGEEALAFGIGFHAIVLVSWALAGGFSVPLLVRGSLAGKAGG